MLGVSAAGYIRITRIDRIDQDFHCYVELHLRADRYSDLARDAFDNLSGKNIRTTLETRYGVIISTLAITAAATSPPDGAARYLDIQEDNAELQINVTGYDGCAPAVFTQTAYAPSGPYQMKFLSDIR